MRKIPIMLMLVCLAVSLAAIAGCGGDSGNTIETPEGKLTIEESGEEGEGGKVTIEGEEREESIEVKEAEPSEEELGLPIYPGVEYVPESCLSAKVNSEEGEVNTVRAEFVTGDELDEVTDWYQDVLGEPMASDQDEVTWVMQDTSGTLINVTLEKEEDKVRITLTRITGAI
ncbi:MAG: hypothetical protein SWK76_03765 [Actinomycetota bacterium]|nr:hypothetical protein [Actinomycetota bacterium]